MPWNTPAISARFCACRMLRNRGDLKTGSNGDKGRGNIAPDWQMPRKKRAKIRLKNHRNHAPYIAIRIRAKSYSNQLQAQCIFIKISAMHYYTKLTLLIRVSDISEAI